MLKSMTGYGKAEKEYQGKKITIELKSLNSKQMDINTRIPPYYKEKELDMRRTINNILERGKIELNIYVENFSADTNYSINREVAKKYFRELKALSSELHEEDNPDYLSLLIKMPDVLVNEKTTVDEEEWRILNEGIDECLKDIDEYRKSEGKELETDFHQRIDKIEEYLDSIAPFEEGRKENIREKLQKDITELLNDNQYDKNRFEQEVIYYLEKFDITEEKVRLKNHCNYFRNSLKENHSNGKKLNFISQEIGREINTIGSKANEKDIQQIVVLMKEELEKIKEQIANIL
ncbi:MAG: YicC family protein [Bacteroidales bacterium]|nr:YicC family protein [Bacteroidales bacterium]MCF8337530.1 YicC family protein [Bacteroidales bacterium]